MRSYVVFFHPNDADQFRRRVRALGGTGGLPNELVHEKLTARMDKHSPFSLPRKPQTDFHNSFQNFPAANGWPDAAD
jgi:hypothetical protein